MGIKNILFRTMICFAVTSCAFIPVASDKQPYKRKCDMVTKKLTLKSTEMGTLNSCNNHDLAECIVISGILASASYIVSESIVLIGNTLHWSEYKLIC